jgi:hypothetical protein
METLKLLSTVFLDNNITYRFNKGNLIADSTTLYMCHEGGNGQPPLQQLPAIIMTAQVQLLPKIIKSTRIST